MDKSMLKQDRERVRTGGERTREMKPGRGGVFVLPLVRCSRMLNGQERRRRARSRVANQETGC